MASDVQVRQFRLDDKDALLAFLALAYPDEPRKQEPAFWKWHYLENPYTSLNDIPLWIITSADRVVGQLATIPVRVKVGLDEVPAIWILDFVILPEFRGQGLGKRLVLAARERFPTMITLGINEQSTAVFRSLKWVALGGLHRYHRLLYPGDAFGEMARVGPLRTVANICYAPFRPRYTPLATNGNGEIRKIRTFDSSFEDLWRRARKQWTCAVVRDAGYLSWQFAQQPGKKFDALGVYEQNELIGYVVLFFRKPEHGNNPPKAAISDICYVDDGSRELIDTLLNAALSLAMERRAGSLVVDVHDPRVEAALQRHGFWRIKNAPRFMASTSEHQELIYNQQNWFLTRADSDVSIFEQPNL